MDGKQLFAYGDMVTFTCNGKRLVGDVVPVRSPYLAAVPYGHGGPRLWQRYYPGAQPNIPQDGGPGATQWTLT